MKDEQKKYQYLYMSPAELEDTLTTLRHDILKRVRALERDFRALMALQARREKVEIRLEELGGSIGNLKSKSGSWKQGMEEVEDEENE